MKEEMCRPPTNLSNDTEYPNAEKYANRNVHSCIRAYRENTNSTSARPKITNTSNVDSCNHLNLKSGEITDANRL